MTRPQHESRIKFHLGVSAPPNSPPASPRRRLAQVEPSSRGGEMLIEYKIDKSVWGPGPWQAEPDRKEWKDSATGLPCLAHRSRDGGNWCGYVAIPPGHIAHGKGYDDVEVEVHGGLTYAGECSGHICHVPAPGEPDNVYWLGFDCHHCDDLAPGYHALFPDKPTFYREIYRTLEYVEAECARLAAQLQGMHGGSAT